MFFLPNKGCITWIFFKSSEMELNEHNDTDVPTVTPGKSLKMCPVRLILVRYYLQDTLLYAHFHAEHQPGHQEKSENVWAPHSCWTPSMEHFVHVNSQMSRIQIKNACIFLLFFSNELNEHSLHECRLRIHSTKTVKTKTNLTSKKHRHTIEIECESIKVCALLNSVYIMLLLIIMWSATRLSLSLLDEKQWKQ